MGNSTTLIAELKEAVIEVNGNKHNLALVMSRAGSCPLIDVDVQELTADPENAGQRYKVSPVDLNTDDLSLVVYKHAGKLSVVVGHSHLLKAHEKKHSTVKARLLTSVALKEARIAEHQPAPVAPAPFNPPRITDNRSRYGSANAGPSPERYQTGSYNRDPSRPQHASFSNNSPRRDSQVRSPSNNYRSQPRLTTHETPKPRFDNAAPPPRKVYSK